MPKFIPFTSDQRQAAKQIDLAAFLQNLGEIVKKSGSEYEWVGHHVTLRGNQWFDQYKQKGGTAVDFVREYFGLSYPQAVSLLLGENVIAEPSEVCRWKQRPFVLPPKNDNMRRVYAYLIKQRYIDRSVIYQFAHQGLIYEDSKYHNAVFVGLDKDGKPRHAHKKSTSINDSSYRGNQSGSEAAFSFHWIGKNDTIYVFEGPIDLMSFITLHPNRWQENNYVALCSVADKALFHQLSENPNLRRIILCLDNDEAGLTAMYRITEKLAERGYDDTEIMLSKSKDWNEELVSIVNEQEVEPSWGMSLS